MTKHSLLTFVICTAFFLSGFSLTTFAQVPPRAYDVAIQGTLNVGSFLSGIYSYADTNNRPEGNSFYQWYRADSITQLNPVAIDSATRISYVTDSLHDRNKYIAFEVTPIAHGTIDTVGIPVRVWSAKVISITGIQEKNYETIRFYPNPATSEIFILNAPAIEKPELYSYDGRNITQMISFSGNRIDISSLPGGIYLLKVQFSNHKTGIGRLVKL